jgi:hypothetical protein
LYRLQYKKKEHYRIIPANVNWFGYNKRKRNIIEPFQLILIDSVKWFSGIFWNECVQITLNSHIGKKINTHFKLFGFHFFGFERTCWRLFHKRVVNSKFDVYFFITENTGIYYGFVFLIGLVVCVVCFLSSFCIMCVQYCKCLWTVQYWLHLRFVINM